MRLQLKREEKFTLSAKRIQSLVPGKNEHEDLPTSTAQPGPQPEGVVWTSRD
jgi:hypothetical protein